MEGSGSVQIITNPDPGDPKTYPTDPTNPEHCPAQTGIEEYDQALITGGNLFGGCVNIPGARGRVPRCSGRSLSASHDQCGR
jgi:hypothetical protein